MLKTLKWVYDLGVHQERVRIAAHLQREIHHAQLSNEIAMNMLSEIADSKKPNKARMQRLDFSIAVNDRVREIISDIFKQNNGEWVDGGSIMFPEEEK